MLSKVMFADGLPSAVPPWQKFAAPVAVLSMAVALCSLKFVTFLILHSYYYYLQKNLIMVVVGVYVVG